MGCDIHCYAEKQVDSEWTQVNIIPQPFNCRSYSIFGFLADVRNYSAITPIARHRGLPKDCTVINEYKTHWKYDGHSASWISLEELIEFDYNQILENRRVKRTENGIINGGCTCEIEEGEKMSYKDFLGEWYFEELNRLKENGVERIVFWFDN